MDRRRDEGTAALAPAVRAERHGNVLVVALAGEHDLTSRDSVRDAVDDALDARLAVVVDLRETELVDSVVAATFLEARKKAGSRNLGLGVVLSDVPQNAVRRMFELTELTTVFAVYPTVAEAVEGVRAGFGPSA